MRGLGDWALHIASAGLGLQRQLSSSFQRCWAQGLTRQGAVSTWISCKGHGMTDRHVRVAAWSGSYFCGQNIEGFYKVQPVMMAFFSVLYFRGPETERGCQGSTARKWQGGVEVDGYHSSLGERLPCILQRWADRRGGESPMVEIPKSAQFLSDLTL